jgi:hypothetical protein
LTTNQQLITSLRLRYRNISNSPHTREIHFPDSAASRGGIETSCAIQSKSRGAKTLPNLRPSLHRPARVAKVTRGFSASTFFKSRTAKIISTQSRSEKAATSGCS